MDNSEYGQKIFSKQEQFSLILKISEGHGKICLMDR